MLGASYTPTVDFNIIDPLTLAPLPATLVRSVMGDIGGQFGYRIKHWRAEAELFYNYNPWHSLTIDGVALHSKSTNALNPGLSMLGQTNTVALMANGFYDFYSEGESSFSPYLGVGLGYAAMNNFSKFYYKQTYLAGADLSETTRTPALQGIIGIGYFLDDYTRAGLDYRYFTTSAVVDPFGSRAQLSSINLTIIGSFDHS